MGGIYLAARLVAAVSVKAPAALPVTAAAATEGNDSVRGVILTGVFGVLVALISASALLFRRTAGPDLSELLEVHERLAVIETNQADMRGDIRSILDRLDRRRDR